MTLDARWQQRVHHGFVAVVFLAGLAGLADAVRTLDAAPVANQWILLAVLTLVSGAFAVKVPALNATLSISETFLFALVLLFGWAPAVLTVALDGLAVSLVRRRREFRHVAFNFAEPVVSMWLASQAYYLAGVPPLHGAAEAVTLTEVGLPALLLSATYFLINSALNALAMATEAGSSPLALWRKYFLWVSLNYFGGASIAVLLAVNTRTMTLGGLLAIAPLILVSYFTFKSSMGRLEDENVHLAEVNRLYLKVVETLAMAVDAKDQVTHGHIRRVQTFALRLARALGVKDPSELKAIEAAALLHDMGKLAVPEHILNKPGKLTEAEYERMKLHAPLGADMLSAVGFPYPVVPIVRHHHENWDGTGYPDGLTGDAIPIGARVLSVVDCYDALRSHRPYRRALSPEQALEIVKERRGTMYDPAVVDAFEAIRADIEAESVDEPLPEVLDRFARAARDMRNHEGQADAPLPVDVRIHATDTLLQLCDRLARTGREASLSETCDVIERHLRRLVPAGLIAVLVRDEQAEELRVVHASGFGERLIDGLAVPMGYGISGWAAANRQPVVNADPALDVAERFDGLNPRYRSTMAVPLNGNRAVFGALVFFATQPGAFTEVQARTVELLAAAITDAVSTALARQPDADAAPAASQGAERSLDVLLRRDGFWNTLGGRSLGVLHLRSVDGPEAITHAAVAVNTATRVADLIFRVQPDELIVLMPDCDASAGQIITGRLAETFAAMPGSARLTDAIHVGFACSPYDGTSLRDLLEISHRRLDASVTAETHLVPGDRPVPQGGVS